MTLNVATDASRPRCNRSPARQSWAMALVLATGLAMIFPCAPVEAQTAPSGGSAVRTGAAQTGRAPVLPAGASLPGVQPAAPVRATPTPNAAAPNPAGFSLPNAGGLASPFPPQLVEAAPPGTPLLTGTPPPLMNRRVVAVPQVMALLPVAEPLPGPGPGPFTALQILQSFQGADVDGDGQLSRTEAQYLRLRPRSFEDIDRNKDGLLTRGEYESAFR